MKLTVLQALTPLLGRAISHRVSLYADDLVILIAPSADDLNCVQQILKLFARASGLITNIDKCVASQIWCIEETTAAIQEVFPCAVALFPCKYLGRPLSLARLRRSDEQTLVDKVAPRIPTYESGMLTHVGHVFLTKVTLSAVPVHTSIACCLSAWAISQIDKRQRAFLWSRSETTSGEDARWHGRLSIVLRNWEALAYLTSFLWFCLKVEMGLAPSI